MRSRREELFGGRLDRLSGEHLKPVVKLKNG